MAIKGDEVTIGWSESQSLFQYHVTFWSHLHVFSNLDQFKQQKSIKIPL